MVPANAMLSVGMILLAGSVMAAPPAKNAPAGAANNTSTNVAIVREYFFKPEEYLFTGTVITNDLTAKSITVCGHRPWLRSTVDRVVPVGTPPTPVAPPAVKNEQAVFRVDAFCRVSLTNRPVARLSDVHSGAIVDVRFRKQTDSTWIAAAITSAGKHPYDEADLPAAVPKKR
ncbi:MAG: hypothetical protein ACOYOU_09580 [Kiritimatiellia bacterium]